MPAEPAQRPPAVTTLTVQIDTAAEPIAGELCDAGGRRRRFAGWLDLLSGLQAARAVTPSDPQPRS